MNKPQVNGEREERDDDISLFFNNKSEFPSDKNEWLDWDGDGTPNELDFDIDGDGVSNNIDNCASTSLGQIVNEFGCSSKQRNIDAITLTGGIELSVNNTFKGTVLRDFIASSFGNDQLTGLQGNDLLFGGDDNDNYILGRNSGHDVIVDVHGENTITFVDDISFNDVASGLVISGSDLVLRIAGIENTVRVENFFTVANTISVLNFESGGSITSAQFFFCIYANCTYRKLCKQTS